MKITLAVPDETAEVYSSRLRPGQSLEQVFAVQLRRFEKIDPRDSVLVVSAVDRLHLEKLLPGLPIRHTADLVARVAALAELSIGRIRFRWTAVQFRELKARAERWRIPVREYAERVVRQIEEQFFSENLRELRPGYRPGPEGEILMPEPTAEPAAPAQPGPETQGPPSPRTARPVPPPAQPARVPVSRRR